MKIKDLELVNKAIILNDKLIIADMHIGYEEAMNMGGFLVPRHMKKEILKDLKSLFEKCGEQLKKVIILGDFKHEFGKINEQEWKDSEEILGIMKKYADKIIICKGNHDVSTGLYGKIGVKLVDYYVENGDLFIHGNNLKEELKKIDGAFNRVFVGHFHSAVRIKEGVRSENYKCYSMGKFVGKDLVILPSFFPLIEGGDIIEENKEGIDFSKFQVYVINEDGEILEFGKVEDLNYSTD